MKNILIKILTIPKYILYYYIMIIILFVFIILIILIVGFVHFRKSFVINKNKKKKNSKSIIKRRRIQNNTILNQININKINKWSKEYLNTSNINKTNIISNNSIKKSFLNRDIISRFDWTFSNKLEKITKINDQRKTGRCWIFSFLNMIKYDLIKRQKLKEDFDLSYNYLFFYNKLETCRYILDLHYKLRHKSLEDRNIDFLFRSGLSGDGGTWNMLINLVNKYGIVPKSVMRDTYHSKNSREMNQILKNILNHSIYEIRENPNLNYNHYIEKKTNDIFNLLVYFLGLPPTKFNWNYYKKPLDSNIELLEKVSIKNMNPIHFLKNTLGFRNDEWVVCGNIPTSSKPFYCLYNIQYCNNMLNGVKTKIFNIPIDELIDLCKKSLDKNRKVWFGCDFGKSRNIKYGIMDPNIYNFSSFIKNKQPLSKGDKLKYKIITGNHAMLLTGYNINNNKIDKWLVENSHGENPIYLNSDKENKTLDNDEKPNGYYQMSNYWLKENVLQVIIHKSIFSKSLLYKLDKAPIKNIKPWSYMSCQLLST